MACHEIDRPADAAPYPDGPGRMVAYANREGPEWPACQGTHPLSMTLSGSENSNRKKSDLAQS